MSWVHRLTREYADSARRLQRYRNQLLRSMQDGSPDAEEHPDLRTVDAMIADLQYGLEWMQSGRQPQRGRSADIHDAYSRSILMDMDLLPMQQMERREPAPVSETQKVELVRILLRLSARERQCYLLHAAHGMSEREIGKELKLSRTTVQKNIERARSKVAQAN